MHSIEVDQDVMMFLEGYAISYASRKGTVFGISHNDILRVILNLDQPTDPESYVEIPGSLNPEDTGSEPARTYPNGATVHLRMRIGNRLLDQHPELNAKKGYFSKDGKPYEKPRSYPAVLFDTEGYLAIASESHLRSTHGINVSKKVSVPKGISSIQGYVKCNHVHD